MNNGPETDSLTTAQVAAKLQVRPRTVATWCKEGLVDHTRLPGGRYRIPRAELERLTTLERIRA